MAINASLANIAQASRNLVMTSTNFERPCVNLSAALAKSSLSETSNQGIYKGNA
jgi:hypothetical protein